MWLTTFITFSLLGVIHSSEFFIDRSDCALYSKNNSVVIDLSSGYNDDEEAFPGYTAYISLCPGRRTPAKCPKESLVCLVARNGTSVVDIGSKVTNVTAYDESSYIVNLESKNGRGSMFITCRNEENPPTFDIGDDGIEKTDFSYTIKWMSTSSCPKKQYKVVNNCILYAENFSFDLRPLQYFSDYIVHHRKDIFVINICKNVSDSRCPPSAICAINKSFNVPAVIAKAEGSVLQYIMGGELTLSYINSNGNGKTVIRFSCSDKSNAVPVINFQSKDEDGNYFFNMSTFLVCPPIITNCLVHDSKTDNYYDLSVLRNEKRNYQVVLNNERIIFNYCGSLIFVPPMSCFGRKYLACLVDQKNTTLAFANESKIEIKSTGAILFTFTGMTMENKTFSFNISTNCSDHNTHSIIKGNHSNFGVFLTSPAACPIKMYRGTKCRAKNLYADNIVDVSSLHQKGIDYFVKRNNESFRINICGHLNRSCFKNKEASVCYTNKHGKDISIGEIGSNELIFKDGQFMQKLVGEPCNENVLRSKVTIIFQCEYFEDNSIHSLPPEFFGEKVEECEFYFVWKTNLVCKDYISSKCSLTSNNYVYNLEPLKNLKENYFVDFKSSRIVLNVCHSLIPEHRMRCHFKHGACIINETLDYILSDEYLESRNYEPLGSVSEGGDLKLVKGSVRLTYRNGGICEHPSEGSHSTSINFICNETINNTYPVFKGQEKCVYNFEWITSFACPTYIGGPNKIPDNKEIKIPEIQSCSVIDPISNQKFDLSPFMSQTWQVENRNISLGICRPTNTPFCPEHSGACLFEGAIGSTNIGDYSSDLRYEEESLYLLYRTTKHKLTKIEFVCNEIDLRPQYIKELTIGEDSITFISWPTVLACKKEVQSDCCHQVKPLCEHYNETYEVDIDQNRKAFLRICKPIIPRIGLLCSNNTPACIGFNNNNEYFSSEKILGKISEQHVYIKNESLTLVYYGGSVCVKQTDITYSTSIRFYCQENNANNYPKFVQLTNQCQYEFEWGSPFLCEGKTPPERTEDCFGDKNHLIVGKRGKYILDLCNPSPNCGSHICKSVSGGPWQQFGVKNGTFNFNSKVIIQYVNPEISKNGHCGAKVVLQCVGKNSRRKDWELKEHHQVK